MQVYPGPGYESADNDLRRGVDPEILKQDGFPVDEAGNLVPQHIATSSEGGEIVLNTPRTQEELKVGRAGIAKARAALSRPNS